MNKKNQSAIARWLLLPLAIAVFITGTILLVMNSSVPEALANGESGETTIRGTVDNTLIVQMSDGVVVMILKLSDGKKYRLRQGNTPGIGKGFNVELVVPVEFEPIKDEVWLNHPNAIPVISVKVTAIPIPGSKDKLVYPPTSPPEVIKGE